MTMTDTAYVMMTPAPKRLSDITKKIKEYLQNAAQGPLIAAADIVEVQENWDSYKGEADGLSFDAWLRKYVGVGRGYSYFSRRHEAVLLLGEDIRRWMGHDAAVLVAKKTKGNQALAMQVKSRLYAEYRAAESTVLSYAQTRRVLYEMLGKGIARKHHCKRCKQLEVELDELKARLAN